MRSHDVKALYVAANSSPISSYQSSSLLPPPLPLAHPHSYHGEYDGCELLLHLVEEAMSFAVEHGLSGHGVFHFLSLFISCLDFLVGSHRVTPGSTVFPYPGFPLRWKMNLSKSYTSKLLAFICSPEVCYFASYK